MLANLRARQRHQRLMRAAHKFLRDTTLYAIGKTASDITAQDFADYVFGRHNEDLPTDEAQRYLTAARVSRGDSTTPTVNTAIHHSA